MPCSFACELTRFMAIEAGFVSAQKMQTSSSGRGELPTLEDLSHFYTTQY